MYVKMPLRGFVHFVFLNVAIQVCFMLRGYLLLSVFILYAWMNVGKHYVFNKMKCLTSNKCFCVIKIFPTCELREPKT